MINHYIYIITNLINGKKYIGKRSCKCPIEKDKYMGSGLALKKAQKKYGIDNFEKKILLICNTEDEAYEEERKAVELVKAWENPMYYNLDGGGRGFGCGEGSPLYGIYGENHPVSKKVVCLNTGEIFSTVHDAAKYVKLANATPITQVCLGKVSTCGKDELGNKLVWRYLEDYEKMSKQDISDAIDVAYKARLSGKKVICLNTKEIFISAKAACKKYNTSNVLYCCIGTYKFAGFCDKLQEKLVWMYLEDYNNKTSDEIKNILIKGKNSGTFDSRYKKFICVNTGEIFNTTTEIREKYNIRKSAVCECCRGIRKSAGKHPITGEKMIWMYLDKYEDKYKKQINVS